MKTINLSYFILILLTLVTYQIGKMGLTDLNISLLVFSFAVVKVVIISENFMQLKQIKGIWRMPIIIWLLIISITITLAWTSQ